MIKKKNENLLEKIVTDCGKLRMAVNRKKNQLSKIGRDVTIFFFLKDPARAWVFFFVCTLSFWWYARQFIDKSVRYQQRGVKTTELNTQ